MTRRVRRGGEGGERVGVAGPGVQEVVGPFGHVRVIGLFPDGGAGRGSPRRSWCGARRPRRPPAAPNVRPPGRTHVHAAGGRDRLAVRQPGERHAGVTADHGHSLLGQPSQHLGPPVEAQSTTTTSSSSRAGRVAEHHVAEAVNGQRHWV